MSGRHRAEGDEMTHHYHLLYPFTVVTSKGGPYDDDAFVAGFQCGNVDRALVTAAACGADRYTATVRTVLVDQLELIGMARGWAVIRHVTPTESPEWTFMTFQQHEEGPDE